VAAALQIWSPTFTASFDSLPRNVRQAVERKINELSFRLATFSHQRLRGRAECKLRVGDYRVLYEFDLAQGKIYLHYVGHRRDIYK
jgi:mRNA interferase RelE/StbE